MDSQRGYLSIFRRGVNGETLFDALSIKRPERLSVLEEAFGRIPESLKFERHPTEAGAEARRFFIEYRRPDGSSLDAERIMECVNRASIFLALKRSLERTQTVYARTNRRLNMGDFWREKVGWFMEQAERFPCEGYSNPRALERAFKKYLNMSYRAFIQRNTEIRIQCRQHQSVSNRSGGGIIRVEMHKKQRHHR
jgi:hypothetical protein